MKIYARALGLVVCLLVIPAGLLWQAAAQTKDASKNDAPKGEAWLAPALTIYNQQFAVVRNGLALDLKPGQNHVEVTDITGHLEPDSVFLRSLDDSRHLRILEQNYRNDPVSEQMLLSLYEGKTIDFLTPDKTTVQGKIIRSGFVPHSTVTYGQRYYQAQAAYVQQGAGQPVIEVNGKLQFSMPGQPIFPALADDTVLKPTLSWELDTDKPGKANAELSYVTGGMNWEASYNVVAPPKGSDLELLGWVTLDNQSGKTFRDARIKLMAGDVNKIQPNDDYGEVLLEHVRRWSSGAPKALKSPKKPSTNITSTLSNAPPLSTTAKPSKSNSSAPTASNPKPSTSTTAGKSIKTTAAGPWKPSARRTLRHAVQSQSLGHAGIQKQRRKSSRHAAPQRPRPFLSPR